MMRSRAARWFEVAVARPSLASTLTALANTGLVELDASREHAAPLDLGSLRERLDSAKASLDRFGDYRPDPVFRELEPDDGFEHVLDGTLQRLDQWNERAAPIIRAIERLRHEETDVAVLRDFLSALAVEDGREGVVPGEMTPDLTVVLAMAEPDNRIQAPDHLPRAARDISTPTRRFVLFLVRRDDRQALESTLAADRVELVDLPDWATGGVEPAAAEADRRLESIREKLRERLNTLSGLSTELRIAEAVGDLLRLDWLCRHMADLPVSEYVGWITGWTTDVKGRELERALLSEDLPAVIHFPAHPPSKTPPTINRNPAWMRPFELFARLLGTPEVNEADPTALVAFIAPMLFGFMFGDVGQGAVLVVGGLLLRRRWPALTMLIPGGVMAMFFGFMFGSLFGSEGIIPALWLHPLSEPLPVLAVPLMAGVVILMAGLSISAFNAAWHDQLGDWLRTDAGILVAYLGLLAILPAGSLGAAVALAGTVWALAGATWEKRDHPGGAFFGALGEFAERLLQLLVNTLSFVRVGAFALAHAGLGVALVALADAAGPVGTVIVFVLGNAFIIALEGLVVGIQTSRLILFEFFIRFLKGAGRPFRPTLTPTQFTGESTS